MIIRSEKFVQRMRDVSCQTISYPYQTQINSKGDVWKRIYRFGNSLREVVNKYQGNDAQAIGDDFGSQYPSGAIDVFNTHKQNW